MHTPVDRVEYKYKCDNCASCTICSSGDGASTKSDFSATIPSYSQIRDTCYSSKTPAWTEDTICNQKMIFESFQSKGKKRFIHNFLIYNRLSQIHKTGVLPVWMVLEDFSPGESFPRSDFCPVRFSKTSLYLRSSGCKVERGRVESVIGHFTGSQITFVQEHGRKIWRKRYVWLKTLKRMKYHECVSRTTKMFTTSKKDPNLSTSLPCVTMVDLKVNIVWRCIEILMLIK